MAPIWLRSCLQSTRKRSQKYFELRSAPTWKDITYFQTYYDALCNKELTKSRTCSYLLVFLESDEAFTACYKVVYFTTHQKKEIYLKAFQIVFCSIFFIKPFSNFIWFCKDSFHITDYFWYHTLCSQIKDAGSTLYVHSFQISQATQFCLKRATKTLMISCFEYESIVFEWFGLFFR